MYETANSAHRNVTHIRVSSVYLNNLTSFVQTCVSLQSSLADLIKYHKRSMKAQGVLLVHSASVNKRGYLMVFSRIVSKHAPPPKPLFKTYMLSLRLHPHG